MDEQIRQQKNRLEKAKRSAQPDEKAVREILKRLYSEKRSEKSSNEIDQLLTEEAKLNREKRKLERELQEIKDTDLGKLI